MTATRSLELLDPSRSLVLAIDLQGKLVRMAHRSELVIAATRRLLELADAVGVPVLLTEQYPEGLGPTCPEVEEVFERLAVAKRKLVKTSFGCCGESGFEDAVAELLGDVPVERRQFVVAGIEAHVCVMQTVLELLGRGSDVHVCWECVSGRGAEYRAHALERMQQAGAQITNHESVVFEWMRDKIHPAFRAVNRILREGQLTG